MTPLVSVVIPFFNRQATIGRVIESVLRQTMQDFEIIVVDDASDQDLGAALGQFVDNKRVRSLRLPTNRGPSAARNAGVQAATGRFIAFLDSDDEWLPDKLRLQYLAIMRESDPERVICATRTRILLGNGREIIRPLRPPSQGQSLAHFIYVEGGFTQPSSLFLARSLALRNPFDDDFRQLEDHLFLIQLGASGAQYLLLEDVLTIWSNAPSTHRLSSTNSAREWTDIVSRFLERAKDHLSPKVQLAAEARLLHNRLWHQSKLGSIRLLVRAVLSGALPGHQFAIMLGRNLLPTKSYNLARHVLFARANRPVDPAGSTSSLEPVAMPDPDAKPYYPERKLEGKRSVLFVTDEPFLPPRNGSQQTYASVARAFNDENWTTYCISFLRDQKAASSPQLNEPYRAMFTDYLLVPGWTRGGTMLGRLGQLWREVNRAVTGNVLASHPLLVANDRVEAARIVERVRSWNVGSAYVHKLHSMQLLGRAIDVLDGVPIVLDIHDDLVNRAAIYNTVYRELFKVLPTRLIMSDHFAAWLRHRFPRTHVGRSRQTERALLRRCDTILVGSFQETATYLADPAIANKVIFSPVVYDPPEVSTKHAISGEFDIGFIGSSDAINLHALLYFRDEILPRVSALFPGLRILIAGHVVAKARPIFRDVNGVDLLDRLDDIADFYRAVRVSAIPVRYGTGVSIRLLEALRYKTPVVSTSIGVRGLGAVNFDNVVITDDPDDFAHYLVAFARPADKESRAAAKAEGKRYTTDRYLGETAALQRGETR